MSNRRCRGTLASWIASITLILASLGMSACGNGGGGGTPASDAGDVADANQAPTAAAAAPNQAAVGTTITLDGSASSDPDGDSLMFSWSIATSPSGSTTTLQSPNAETTDFVVDASGTYEFELTVDDGQATSTDTVSVAATNQAPTADAGSGATVIVGESVTLDGSASSDPEGATLSYSWSIVTSPSNSTATIQDSGQATASITPDVAGDYTVELEVSDGSATDTDRVTISASADEPGTVVYVRESGSDDNPGTEAFPVATLQEGVSLAKNTGSVERIDLDGVTYDQGFMFVVDKELTIVGEGSDTTILDASGSTAFQIVDGGALTLIDLAVENGEPAIDGEAGRFAGNGWRCEGGDSCISAGGLFEDGGSSLSLTDSELVGQGSSTGTAVAYNSGNMTVDNTTIKDFQIGLSPVATGLRLTNSTIGNCDTGILLLSGTAEAVDILDSTFSGNGIGVDLTSAEDVLVDNSTFENHQTRAILVQVTSAVVVRDSTIKGSARSGIRAVDETVLTLGNDTIHDNGTGNPSQFTDRAGVFLTDEAQLSGADGNNEIYGHPQDNIVFQGSSSGTLLDFTLRDAQKAAAFISTTEKVTVDGGTIESNENGFFVSGDSSLEVSGATITGNRKDGINFGASGSLRVQNTDVMLNGNNQFHIRNDPSAVELGTSSGAGGNLIEMAADSDWGILDARDPSGGTFTSEITAGGNTYTRGSLTIDFSNHSIDGQVFVGPTTYDGSSAGDPNAIFKIVNDREIEF
jgi:hypothetical protein